MFSHFGFTGIDLEEQLFADLYIISTTNSAFPLFFILSYRFWPSVPHYADGTPSGVAEPLILGYKTPSGSKKKKKKTHEKIMPSRAIYLNIIIISISKICGRIRKWTLRKEKTDNLRAELMKSKLLKIKKQKDEAFLLLNIYICIYRVCIYSRKTICFFFSVHTG